MTNNKNILSSAITLALLSPCIHANEKDTVPENRDPIETIEVISGFRDQNIQQVPASVSIQTEFDIERRNAQNLEEILLATANVNFSSGSSRARFYQIRGIGERSQFKEPINPSVGVIIDGVDFSGIASVSSLYDVKQVEVLRGPQGTKFGASAMAGVVDITTHNPTDEFESSFRTMAGNYDSASLGLTVSGPLDESLSYRIAMEKYVSDGFVDNDFLGKDDTNDKNELTLRSKFKYLVSANFTVDLALFYLDFDNGYDTFSLDNNRNTLSDEPGFDKQRTIAASITSKYTGYDTVDLINIFSFSHSNIDYGYDEDWTHTNFHDWEYSSTDYYYRDQQTITADFRFQSNEKHKIFNDSTDWVFGLFFKEQNQDLLREYTYAVGDFVSKFDTSTLAGYVQLNSALTDKLNLEAGLRVEYRDSDYEDSELVDFSPDDTMVGGKVALSYQINSKTMAYASIDRGFKAGGVNTVGTLSEDRRAFDAEYLLNYELGLKQTHLNGDAYTRLSVFYMDRDDMQVSTYSVNKRPDGSEEFLSYFDNAAEGTNIGLELEAGWQITDTVDVYTALAYLDSEYKDFINGNDEDVSGRDQAHAPNYQYSVGVNYFLGHYWLFNAGIEGKDAFYFSDSHNEESDNVNLVNASISYISEDWQVKLWGRNITDEDYKTRGFYFGNDPRDGYTSKNYYQLGAPAEFGVTFDYDF